MKTDYRGMIVLHGELFKFNDTRKILFRVDAPLTAFRTALLTKEGNNRVGIINAGNGKVFRATDFGDSRLEFTSLKRFSIPEEILENGHRLSEKQIEAYNQQSLASKAGYYFVDKQLSLRINGQLPEVHFDGARYQVDLKRCELRHAVHKAQRLRLGKESPWQTSVKFYDPSTKSLVQLPEEKIKSMPHIWVVSFPPLNHFDIVGAARMSGLPPTALVCDHPLRPDPAAIKTQNAALILERQQKAEIRQREKAVTVQSQQKQRGRKI